ncbi:hypothetical protein I546_5131 [Mycobacterium kansasii 732]|nr:hypothetical protein I546_5131 [Mycobacterium kansasii 732]
MLATSGEPIGAPGEVTWRVPSLSLADEAWRAVAGHWPIRVIRVPPGPPLAPPSRAASTPANWTRVLATARRPSS